jgi:hypothetical protein
VETATVSLSPVARNGRSVMKDAIAQMEWAQPYLAPQPLINVLGVDYVHLQVHDGTDLYLTEYALPFAKCLLPENHWRDAAWRDSHRVRLLGSSDVFRLTTKEVDGRSKDVVIKWNRMGQDVPGETAAIELAGAEFNSPFSEFSLVLEMRNTRYESPGQLYTHKPLAIYVPRRFVEAKRLGRKQRRMEAIERSHGEIELDWNRNYAVIYEWLKGIDAARAYGKGLIDREGMIGIFERANQELETKGFRVLDNKPRHIIVRPKSRNGLARDKSGAILYGLVDFELLQRTQERENTMRASKRQDYLVRQVHRFETREQYPPGITPVTIMGVDYIYGQVESTGGALWVVGKDPILFDYFLPEKWRKTPRTKLSVSPQMFKTVTKDNINLVWRVSRVGERPDVDPFVRAERRILAHGYNSPFEEFAIAMELSRRGIETKYPRAIYMTGHRSTASPSLTDLSRYENHAELQTPDGRSILGRHREYISIWGYWNGPDDMLAVKDESIYEGVDALSAYRDGLLTQRAYLKVMRTAKKRLAEGGIEDLSLRGDHLLLSVDRSHNLAKDEAGLPLVRISKFELLKRIASSK